MAETRPTSSIHTNTRTVQDIVSLHNRILEWQRTLDEEPCEEEEERDIEKVRATLEKSVLVPAVHAFTGSIKDASKELSDWTCVMDVMVTLKKEDLVTPNVEDAMDELKVAVKSLTVIMLALREKFYL